MDYTHLSLLSQYLFTLYFKFKNLTKMADMFIYFNFKHKISMTLSLLYDPENKTFPRFLTSLLRSERAKWSSTAARVSADSFRIRSRSFFCSRSCSILFHSSLSFLSRSCLSFSILSFSARSLIACSLSRSILSLSTRSLK